MSYQKRKQNWIRPSTMVLGLLLLSLTLFRDRIRIFIIPVSRSMLRFKPMGISPSMNTRTYAFQGSFSWAQLWIPLQVTRDGRKYDITVENFRILDEDGTPLRTEINRSSRRMEVKWHYSAADEERTFHIGYTVKNGIASYPEVTELYWQVIGDGWDRPTRSVEVKVFLPVDVPSDKELLVIWARPPFRKVRNHRPEDCPVHCLQSFILPVFRDSSGLAVRARIRKSFPRAHLFLPESGRGAVCSGNHPAAEKASERREKKKKQFSLFSGSGECCLFWGRSPGCFLSACLEKIRQGI